MSDREKKELERLRNSVSELSSLNEISSAINSSMAVENISTIIVDKCIKHTNSAQGVIFLLEEKQSLQEQDQFKTFIRGMYDSREDIPFHMHTSLAGYMIKNKKLLTINDPQNDNPLARMDFEKLGIKTLLAAPLLAQSGLIGVLALFNKRDPEGFTNSDRRFLGIVGTQCAQVVEGARLYAQERKLISIRNELEVAKSIQQGFLPKTNLFPDANSCFGINIPAKEIGGDFFDIVPCGDKEFFISIGDVVGKGVPAALLMANTQAVLRSQLRSGHQNNFSMLAGNLNHLVCEFTSPGQFITGLFGSFDRSKREFQFISAGHQIPIVVSDGKLVPQNFESDLVFGVMPDIQFNQHTMSMPENSTMLLYTDGISEAENDKGEQFGDERTAEYLCSVAGQSAKEICEQFVKTIKEFSKGTPQSDDITVVVAKSD